MPTNMSPTSAKDYLSKSSKVFGCSRIAAKFGLEDAKKSLVSCFEQVLNGSEDFLRSYSVSFRQEMKNLVADFVVSLATEADHQFVFQIAEKALRSLGC